MNKLLVINLLLRDQINMWLTILQSHNQSKKTVKVTLREGEALICVNKLSKNIKRCAEIIITNHQVLLILSEIDNRKKAKKKAYISICCNKIISYTLTIFIREKNFIEYTNDQMRYIGMNALIKNEIIHFIREICKNSIKNTKGLGRVSTKKY